MYCQLSDVKESLDITGSTYDVRISEYIAVASDWIDQYCLYSGIVRPFEIAEDSTRHFDGYAVNGRLLTLDVPFVSVTTVTNGDGVVIPSAGYRFQPRNHPRHYQIRLNNNYSWYFDDNDAEIAITGKFGYSKVPPLPVVEACRHYAGWMHQRWQSGLNRSSASSELGTVSEITTVPPEVKTLLEPYVNRRMML